MSYPANLTPVEYAKWREAMNRPVPKGTVVGGRYEVLEDTTAHGCPRVRDRETGQEFCKTLYLHYDEPGLPRGR